MLPYLVLLSGPVHRAWHLRLAAFSPGGDGGRRSPWTSNGAMLIRRLRQPWHESGCAIKKFVAEGISRDEIANQVGVTVGSLQVTCSRLGISLRRIILPNGSGHHSPIPTPCSVGIAHAREQKEISQPTAPAAPSANFAITTRYRGKEQTTDIPLPSAEIEVLSLEAWSRDLAIAELIGQVLVAAINKDMIQKILR